MPSTGTQNELFVRYRHGNKIIVQPDIGRKLRETVRLLEMDSNYKNIFSSLIEPINDGGSGPGVHPESTWYAAIKEIFEVYEPHNKPVSESLRLKIIGFLRLISDRRVVENKWDDIKAYIMEHIEELSGWSNYSSHRPYLQNVERDSNGEYFQIESGQKIIISGTKTEKEEKYEFIANDFGIKYGRIKKLLNMVALLDIANQCTRRREDFSPHIKCLIPESDYSLSALDWRWYLPALYDYYPIEWRPKSCFSDPEWLAADLVITYSAKSEFAPSANPSTANLQMSPEYERAFEGFPYKLQVALKTGLVFVETPIGSEDPEEVIFEFSGRVIIWVNGNKFVYPTLIVPCAEENLADGLELSHKFISLLVKESGTAIVEIFNIGTPARGLTRITQPRTLSSLGLQHRYVQSALRENLSNDQWVAYAFFKEGVNADSDFYAFLSFYKIIELAFRGDKAKVDDWIDNNIDNILGRVGASNWKQEISTQGIVASFYLRNAGRNAIAHFQNDRRGVPTNPDNSEDLRNINRDLPVIRALANEIFEQNLIN
jgi:hypothetical protein